MVILVMSSLINFCGRPTKIPSPAGQFTCSSKLRMNVEPVVRRHVFKSPCILLSKSLTQQHARRFKYSIRDDASFNHKHRFRIEPTVRPNNIVYKIGTIKLSLTQGVQISKKILETLIISRVISILMLPSCMLTCPCARAIVFRTLA